jgi:hypothetical protein
VFQVNVTSIGTITPVSGTGTLHYAINGGAVQTVPLTVVEGNLYSATLPGVACTDIITFHITAQGSNGTTFKDPATGAYSTVAASGTEITIEDTLEGDTSSWTVTAAPSLTGGGWQVADPNGTLNGITPAAPEEDAGAADDEVKAFVTQNGATGGAANVADVDGGPAWLVSPTLDLTGTDATISYDRWFYCEDAGTAEADFLFAEISNNNGSTWVPVHNTGGTNGAWESVNFRVGQYVTPNSQIKVRFWTQDAPNNSVTEAAVDNFTVEELICGEGCPADVTGNGAVDVDDLLMIINAWGGKDDVADINDDGAVDVDVLLAVNNAWGDCP